MITLFGCAALLALSQPLPLAAQPAPAPQKANPAKKPGPKPAAQPTDPALVLTGKVQKYYESIQDYSADFIQLYTKIALSQTSEFRGTLKIKKPGLMRWDYDKPAEKMWLVTGEKLYVVDPEFEQVIIQSKPAELANSVRFLFGDGKLEDNFAVKVAANPPQDMPKTAGALELTPKKGANYQKLMLVVDNNSGEVLESIIYETAGNVNRFRFKNVKLNTQLATKVFEYTPPEGWEVLNQ